MVIVLIVTLKKNLSTISFKKAVSLLQGGWILTWTIILINLAYLSLVGLSIFGNISHGTTSCSILCLKKLVLLLGVFGIFILMLSLGTSNVIMSLLLIICICIIIHSCITRRLTIIYKIIVKQAGTKQYKRNRRIAKNQWHPRPLIVYKRNTDASRIDLIRSKSIDSFSRMKKGRLFKYLANPLDTILYLLPKYWRIGKQSKKQVRWTLRYHWRERFSSRNPSHYRQSWFVKVDFQPNWRHYKHV